MTQLQMIDKTKSIAQNDKNISAVFMYGSFTKNEGDKYSDIEFYIFLKDKEKFSAENWVSQIHPLALYFTNEFGSEVAIFENMIRGEFHFLTNDQMEVIKSWDGLVEFSDFDKMILVDKEDLLTNTLKEIKNKYLHLWIDEALNKISSLNEDRMSGGISYILLALLFRIDYLLQPQGALFEDIEKINGIYNAKDNKSTLERNRLMIDELKRVKSKSKEEIFKAIVVNESNILRNELTKAIKSVPSPIEKMRNYVFVRMKAFEKLSNYYNAIFDKNLDHFDFVETIRAKYDREELAILRLILYDGARKKVFSVANSEYTALAVQTALKGLEVPLFWKKKDVDIEERLNGILDVLFYGIVRK